jgi:hypothetical protein
MVTTPMNWMDTKIRDTFWSDDDVGELPPEGKLSFLWLLTNSNVNNIGFQVVSKRSFALGTGLKPDLLTATLKGLPRGFVWDEDNGQLRVWIRNFIRYQFGDISPGSRNNIVLNLCRLAAEAPERVREALLTEYRGLAAPYEGLQSGKGLTSPLKGPEQSRAEQSTLKGGVGGTGAPEDWEVFDWANKWPGEPATGAPKLPIEWVKVWLSRMNARSGGWPMDWKRALVSAWRVDFRQWVVGGQEKNAAPNSQRKPTGETPPQRRFRLDRELEGLMEQLEALKSVGADYRPLEPQIEAVKLELKELEI